MKRSFLFSFFFLLTKESLYEIRFLLIFVVCITSPCYHFILFFPVHWRNKYVGHFLCIQHWGIWSFCLWKFLFRRMVLVKEPVEPEKKPIDIIPQEFAARTLAQEYGGGAFAVSEKMVFFSNYKDQRLYKQIIGGNLLHRLCLKMS